MSLSAMAVVWLSFRILVLMSLSHAFITPASFVSRKSMNNLETLSLHTQLHSHLSPVHSFYVAVDDEVSAFTDQIDYLDGPVRTMLGVFGVVVVALIGFKLLTDQMDSAIQQVLVDFERTMQTSYPQRWQNDLRPALEGLEGDERQQRLMRLMEDLQRKDPEFMSRVQQKMK